MSRAVGPMGVAEEVAGRALSLRGAQRATVRASSSCPYPYQRVGVLAKRDDQGRGADAGLDPGAFGGGSCSTGRGVV